MCAARAHRGCSQKLRSYREVRNTRGNEVYQSERLDRHRLRVRALIRELLVVEYRWTGNRCMRVRLTDCGAPNAHFVTARPRHVRDDVGLIDEKRGRRKRGEKEKTKLHLRFFFVRETRQFDPFRANQFIELFRGR